MATLTLKRKKKQAPEQQKKQKKKHINQPATAPKEAEQLYKALLDTLPVFTDDKPLKIGIHKDIYKLFPRPSRRVVRMAVGLHTTRKEYRKNLVVGADRYTLMGAQDGVVEKYVYVKKEKA